METHIAIVSGWGMRQTSPSGRGAAGKDGSAAASNNFSKFGVDRKVKLVPPARPQGQGAEFPSPGLPGIDRAPDSGCHHSYLAGLCDGIADEIV